MQPTLREWLGREPFALTLSAGFFGFFAHAGFLTALLDAGLRPARLSGSSAGALVAGLWASGMEPHDMKAELLALQRPDFWDPAPGLGLLRGQLFAERLQQYLRAPTFALCRAPLAVTVFDLSKRRGRVITDGALAPAIQASCTFPGLFHPVQMEGSRFIDGALADRTGLIGIPEGSRVLYHHLVTRSKVRRYFKRFRTFAPRAQMVPLIVDGLPAVGPFHLDRGRHAFDAARSAVARALDRPRPEPGAGPEWIAAT